MLYDQTQLQEMCSKVDLLEYASQTIDFKRAGADSYAAHCPLHNDDTASLFITPSKNLFYCFSCHRKGNILNWMKEYEGLSFNDAVDKLAKMTGTELCQLKQCTALHIYKELKRIAEPQVIEVPNRVILEPSFYEKFDVIPGEPHEWIEEGITEGVMREYDIRIDRIGNRIVYPVYDNDDNLIGAKGRTRFKDYKSLGISKYCNYTKIGTVDYFQGMQQAREAIKKSGEVIIVEGLKSVMKLRQWGYDNVVAAETSHINEAQVQVLLKLGVRTATIAFDSDVPYSKVIGSISRLFRFVNVFVVIDSSKLLGAPEDKNSPCDKGVEIWRELYSARKKVA